MGAWGTSLYSNDTCCDVRDMYSDGLRTGLNNRDATNAVLLAFRDIIGKEEEEPLLWFALADTQWDFGRLLPEIKERALYWLNKEEELNRWAESDPKKLCAWIEAREKLREKLNTNSPREKTITKYRSYHCDWNLGDVFAYRFCTDISKLKGLAKKYMNMFPPDPWLAGKYMIIRKVSERAWWPESIIPEMCAYRWIGVTIPTLEEIKNLPKQPMMYPKASGINKKRWQAGGEIREKLIKDNESFILVKTTPQSFPKDKVIYLGNLPGDDLIPYSGEDTQGKGTLEWFGMQRFFYEYYKAWNEYDRFCVEKQ